MLKFGRRIETKCCKQDCKTCRLRRLVACAPNVSAGVCGWSEAFTVGTWPIPFKFGLKLVELVKLLCFFKPPKQVKAMWDHSISPDLLAHLNSGKF